MKDTFYTLAFVGTLALAAFLYVRSMSRYLASRGGNVLTSDDDCDEGRARVVAAGAALPGGQRGGARLPISRSANLGKGGPTGRTKRRI
jgi:hypothetical protein